jgi:predicted esterase
MNTLKLFQSRCLTGFGIFYLFLVLSFSSCQKQNTEPVVTAPTEDGIVLDNLKCYGRGSLVDSKLLFTLTADQLKALNPAKAPLLNFGVSIYKIGYLTEYKGRIIKASGAIGIPILPAGAKAAVVVFAHGTKMSGGDSIPSSGLDPATMLTTAFGFITISPDYIGYGDSKDIFHPYLINAASNAAVCDMMIAGRLFLSQKRIIPKSKLFMYGFSQGGLVTMAAQKAIENDPFYKYRIHLTAVVAGSGPYELNSLSLQPIIAGDFYYGPTFIPFATIAYNEYYGFGRTLDQMFKDNWGQKFMEMLKENKSFYEINPLLPYKLSDLMQDDFKKELASGNSVFNRAFDSNNTIDGWIPKTQLRLYHSPVDPIVPYANSVAAYNAFTALGSPVQLIPTPPLDHISSINFSIVDALMWFATL